MKSSCFLVLAICALLGFSSCSDNSNDPEPEAKKTFTGCRLVKNVYSTDGSFREYIYDNTNNIIRVNSCGASGGIGSYDTYDYDAQGRITSSKLYDLSSSSTDYRLSTYSYNSLNMLISEKQYGKPNNTVLSSEHKYFYDTSGKVDSSWMYYYNPATSTMKPQRLTTYEYDNRNNLTKKKTFVVDKNTDGTFSFTPLGTEEYLNYDNFKSPMQQKSFTLNQLYPYLQFTRNNPSGIIYGGAQEQYIYTYRADSLVAEIKYVNLNYAVQYIYDCN